MCPPSSNRSVVLVGTKEPDAFAHPRMNHICISVKGRLTHAIRKLQARTSSRGNKAQSTENATLKRNAMDILLVFNKMIHFQTNEIFSNEPFIMLDIDALWQEKLVRSRLLNWRPDLETKGSWGRAPAWGGDRLKLNLEGSYGSRNVVHFHTYHDSCQ